MSVDVIHTRTSGAPSHAAEAGALAVDPTTAIVYVRRNDASWQPVAAGDVVATDGAAQRIGVFSSATGLAGNANFTWAAGSAGTFTILSTVATGMFRVRAQGGSAGSNDLILQRNATQFFFISQPQVANSNFTILSHASGWRFTVGGSADVPMVLQAPNANGIFLEAGDTAAEGTVTVRPSSAVNTSFTHFRIGNNVGTARIVNNTGTAGQIHIAQTVDGNITLLDATSVFSAYHIGLTESLAVTGTVLLMNFNYLTFGGSSEQVFTMDTAGNIVGGDYTGRAAQDMTVLAGQASGTSKGQTLILQGGAASGTDQDGGDVIVRGGVQTGTGAPGVVIIDALLRRKTSNGITASTTQTQGQQPLVSDVNEIAVVANANDVVTMPPAQEGLTIRLRNIGANTLQIFPASGDDIGAGVDLSTTLGAGGRVLYTAFDDLLWVNV